MNLAKRSRTGAPASSSFLAWSAVVAGTLWLGGCGGSVYSLGDAPADGGHADGEAGQVCSSHDSCEGGSGFAFGGDDGGGDGSSSGVVLNGGDAGPSGGGDAATGGGCTVKDLSCSGGATGYACSVGDSVSAQPGLSCSSGVINGFEIDYCCFPWPGVGGPCSPDPSFPCGDFSYAYQCTPGTAPPAVDPKLHCGSSFADSNGNNDYCCTYP